MFKPLLIINIAGLSYSAIGSNTPRLSELANRGRCIAVQPPVPALTSTSQATFSTGSPPAEHGIVANGWYFEELSEILNWQRSARLVHGEPIWESVRKVDSSIQTANLFWRHATHATCELKVTERPTYWADGRKSEDIYTEPGSFRDELVEQLGPFPLFRFWGPVADITSTRWIVDATIRVVRKETYGMVLTYLPHLDYDHQRFGPHSSQGAKALNDVDVEAGRLIDVADENGWRIAVVSDYAFEPVSQPIFLNRVLRQNGYIAVQNAANGELLEPGFSKAFAVCDQQIAHVYVNDTAECDRVETLLAETHGVGSVLNQRTMKEQGIAHRRSGQLLAIAEPGCWFAYPYWLDDQNAPDFAGCVAIHAKPGFDPAELFMVPGTQGKFHMAKRLLQKTLGLRAPFDVISTDPTVVRGAHGRIPSSNETRPLLLTSWPIELPEIAPMHDLKSILLSM